MAKNTFFSRLRLLSSFFWIFFISISCFKASPRGEKLKAWMEEGKEIRVLSTIAQIDDVVKEVGGSRVQSWTLVYGDLDPHSYELVKGDNEKFSRADLVFYNGLNLEHGASLSSILQSSSKAISVGDAVAKAHPELILEREKIQDPHLWMDISLWKHIIDPVTEALSRVDPEGASQYRANADRLLRQMEIQHEKLFSQMQMVPKEKRYLLTTHDAFRYFARAYLAEGEENSWETRFAAPEGLAPEGQLSSSDIQAMIDFLKKNEIHVLFPESNLSQDSIRKIASAGKEMGLDVHVCMEPLYGDSMGNLSYFEMMQKNGDVMERNLK